MKNIYVVCGLNTSRSKAIEEFLNEKYASDSEIQIKSAGLYVKFEENGLRNLFIEEDAKKADKILVSDHDKFKRMIDSYFLSGDNRKGIQKLHSLNIPDIFPRHKNAYSEQSEYDNIINMVRKNPEFSRLLGYVEALSPKEASSLMESLYTKHTGKKDLYPDNIPHEERNDKIFPFELLYKTLEHRFPEIDKIIRE